MRLLHVDTLELEEFYDSRIPPYAILSHTWEKEEVTFQDLERYHRAHSLQCSCRLQEPYIRPSKPIREWAGFQKIEKFAKWAKALGHDRIWVDTCCIDKSNSAELSEAINSMFLWYKNAELCGAYLSDVQGNIEDPAGQDEFRRSRWFTRGWTLQELLAPADLVFLNASWTAIGTKSLMKARDRSPNTSQLYQHLDRLPAACTIVAEITGIDARCLKSAELIHSFDIATRLSWASGRNTTRKEDKAYCMLGIAGINMPPLYGEGGKALVRLQEEFMKYHEDLSALAWGIGTWSGPLLSHTDDGLLASSPAGFANIDLVPLTDLTRASPKSLDCWAKALRDSDEPPAGFTNRGFRATLPVIDAGSQVKYGILRRKVHGGDQLMMLPLVRKSDNIYWRSPSVGPCCLSRLPEQDVTIRTETLYIRRQLRPVDLTHHNKLVRYSQLARYGYFLVDSFPPIAVLSPSEQDTAVIDDSIPGEILLRFKAPRTGSSPPRVIILSISFEHQTVELATSEDDGSSMLDVLIQMSDGRNVEFSNPISVPGAGALHAGFLAEAGDGRNELIIELGVPETRRYVAKIVDRLAVHRPWVELRDSIAAKNPVLVC